MSPAEISVGEIVRHIDGPLAPVRCLAEKAESDGPLRGECAFMGLWQRAADAVAEIYDSAMLGDLLDEQRSAREALNYCI